MPTLLNFARKNMDNLITPFGEIDVLLIYAVAATKLKKYLKDKEIACKIWMPHGKIRFLIKRGFRLEPLYVEELIEAMDVDFLKLRSERTLKDAKKDLDPIHSPQETCRFLLRHQP